MAKIKVGILGATGMVGQRFVQLLENHPFFHLSDLIASRQSAGKTYAEACQWQLASPMPKNVKSKIVKRIESDFDCQLLFSALDSQIARNVEEKFARAGFVVVSNASAFRMAPDVPLIIPEVNADHLQLIEIQKKNHGLSSGFIVTNPNCSTVPLAMFLHPLHQQFGVAKTMVTTMQAISGAGYPGLPSLDILSNIIPFIQDEEKKIKTETNKILGKMTTAGVEPARFAVSAQVNRVPVLDGHLLSVSVKLKKKATLNSIRSTLSEFRGVPQEFQLPTAPQIPIIVRDEKNRPQPRLDVDSGNGMSIVVGNIRPCSVLDFKMTILSHNTIRGAAGAAILNAELLVTQGYLNLAKKSKRTNL